MIRAARNILFLLLLSPILHAQQTYYWNADEGNWTDPSSWSPQRLSPHPLDDLIFAGPATVEGFPADEQIRSLLIAQGSEVLFHSNENSVLRISGTPSLDIGDAATLRLGGNGRLTLFIAGTGHISGQLILESGEHFLNTGTIGLLVFETGSLFRGMSSYQGSFFEGATESVVFRSGSVFENHIYADPFVAEFPVTVFQEGSVYRQYRSLMPSFSGRTFGNFEVHSSLTFLGSLTQDLVIQNNLVVFGERFEFFPSSGSGNLIIGENLVHSGTGTLEIGSVNWAGSVLFSGADAKYIKTMDQSTGAAIYRLAMKGPDLQLLSPLLVTGELILDQGKILSSDQAVLNIGPSCNFHSLPSIYPEIGHENYGTPSSYIEGPVTRLGTEINRAYVFPVGGSGLLRPLIVHNSQGNLTVTYHRSNPIGNGGTPNLSLPGFYISPLEYWDVSGLGANAQVEPTFMHLNSGISGNPGLLQVLYLSSGLWNNAGNGAFTGSVNSNGSVRSLFAADGRFVLGSKQEIEILPDHSAEISYDLRFPALRLRWKVSFNENIEGFEWYESGNSGRKKLWGKIRATPVSGQENYALEGPIGNDHNLHYQLITILRNGKTTGQEIAIPDQSGYGLRIYPNPVCEKIFIFFPNLSSKSKISIVHINGTVLIQKTMDSPNAEIDVSALKPGLYYINFSSESINRIRSFIKQ